MKLKPLLPSLREKKRYVAFEIQGPQITAKQAEDAVFKSAQGFMGELILANAGFRFLDDTWKNNKGLLRVNAAHVDHAKASIALIDTIESQKVTPRSLGVSGIIKKAVTNYLGE